MRAGIAVVKNYAEACVDSALKAGILDRVRSDLLLVKQSVEAYPVLVLRLCMPSLDNIKRNKVATAAFGDRIHPFTMRFLLLLIKRGRISLLPLLHDAVESIWDVRMNVINVKVTTASSVENTEYEKFNSVVQNQFGVNCRITYAVNPALIAGYHISTSERSIDCSVKSGLEQLRKQLLRD